MSYTGRRDSGFNVYACSQGSLMVLSDALKAMRAMLRKTK